MIATLLSWLDGLSFMQTMGAAAIVIAVLALLWASAQNNPIYRNFRLIYCITNKAGYPDNAKMREWGAFFISSYGFLWLLWDDGMTEWFFGGYMAAWVLAGAYALKKRAEQGDAPLHVKREVKTSTEVTDTSETGKPKPKGAEEAL
jgi:hypothetical protein